MDRKYTNEQIAKAALCTEGAVRNSLRDGRLDENDPLSLAGFILCMRVKQLGMAGVDQLAEPKGIDGLLQTGAIKRGSEIAEPIIDTSDSQEAGD